MNDGGGRKMGCCIPAAIFGMLFMEGGAEGDIQTFGGTIDPGGGGGTPIDK